MKGSFVAMDQYGKLRRIDGKNPRFYTQDILILRVSPSRGGSKSHVQVKVIRNKLDKKLNQLLPFSLLTSVHPADA